jgi:hypothetical protein
MTDYFTPAQRINRGLLTTLSLVLFHRANMRRIWQGKSPLPYPRIMDLPKLVTDPANVAFLYVLGGILLCLGVMLTAVFLA